MTNSIRIVNKYVKQPCSLCVFFLVLDTYNFYQKYQNVLSLYIQDDQRPEYFIGPGPGLDTSSNVHPVSPFFLLL